MMNEILFCGYYDASSFFLTKMEHNITTELIFQSECCGFYLREI